MSENNIIQSYSEKELKKVLHFLDGPLRMALKENVAVIERADIKEGDAVLDIGCGSGFLSLEAAKRVGSTGKVVALDARPEMLEVLKGKAEMQGVGNVIEPVQAYADTLKFEDNTFNTIIMSYLIHENIENAPRIMREAVRVLKKGGKVVISDFTRVEDPARNQEIEDWYKQTDPESDADEVHFELTLKDYENIFLEADLVDVRSEVWLEFHGIVEGRKKM